jgi:uncharacterized damage-inducible protein DinB
MTPEDIRLLYDYNAWADHRTLDSCAALSDEQFKRDLGSSFGSVHHTLVHIMGAEWIWYERWQGRTPSALPVAEQFATLASLRKQWADIERNLMSYVAGLSAADLDRVIEYRNVRGNRFAYLLRPMLQHLVNHGSYHRGQVASLLRQLGALPRPTDLLRYYDVLAGQPEE